MKYRKKMEKFQVYMCLQIASFESTAENKARPLPSPFLISTSRFLILAEVFPNVHMAACSTAHRSATEKKEMSGYLTIPCWTKNVTA